MRYAKLFRAISAVSAMLAYPDFSRADFSYNFDSLTGSPTPGTLLIPGSTTLGTIGQDNWDLASGPSAVVRSDPVTGFSGNYASSSVVADGATAGVDSIYTRVGDNLGLNSTGYATFQFDGEVGPGYTTSTGSTTYKRSEIAPGIDANLDGDIRGDSNSSENGEVGFQFGYEGTGSGWYVRRAAYSNTATVTAATTASGVYRMQLVVNFDANPVVISGANVNDGAGTLYVKQIADANGNPVNDIFRLAASTTANVDLAIATGMGTLGAQVPSNWDGVDVRTSNNGAVDNIVFTNGAPTVASPYWATNSGNWLTAGNFYLTTPNGVGAEADFTAGATSDATVFADSAVTVGTLKFNNTHTYDLTGAGSLTLQTSSGSALVDVESANVQKINLPLIVASNATFNVISGGTLKISDPMTVNAGKTVTQTGAGSVVYESNVTLQSGASIVLGGSAVMDSLSLSGATSAWTSTVDVASRDLVLGSGDITQLSNQIKSGYNHGAWNGNGIQSSAAAADTSHRTALGYASAATLLGLSGSETATFDGQTVDASSLLVKYTWAGDANLDGKVDSSDFTAMSQNFGGSGKLWQAGDFNYDGVVNALDFNAIASEFGATSPPAVALGALVPEPGMLGLCVVGVGLIMRRRRNA